MGIGPDGLQTTHTKGGRYGRRKKPHETLKERFDDFKADVDVHKAEHQEKDAIKDVERAAKHDAKSDVDLDKAAANVDKAIEREAEAKEG